MSCVNSHHWRKPRALTWVCHVGEVMLQPANENTYIYKINLLVIVISGNDFVFISSRFH